MKQTLLCRPLLEDMVIWEDMQIQRDKTRKEYIGNITQRSTIQLCTCRQYTVSFIDAYIVVLGL